MLASLRILLMSLMGSLVFIGVALYFVFSTEDLAATPPFWLLGAQVLGAIGIHGLLEAIGYRTAAITPGTPQKQAMTTSRAALNSGAILRFAVSEALAIASVAAAFVVSEGGFLGYISGAVLSLGLIGYHGYPWERPLAKTQANLERSGATSYFREAIGLPPNTPGAIQEL